VRGYDSLVHFLARKFMNRGEPLEDIVQVGYLGLIKAIERFDPDLGNEFTTFATPTIAGEIRRYFRDKGWAIRFPRRLQELYQQIVRINEQLKNELNRQPTVAEVAARLGVEPEDVLEGGEMGPAPPLRCIGEGAAVVAQLHSYLAAKPRTAPHEDPHWSGFSTLGPLESVRKARLTIDYKAF